MAGGIGPPQDSERRALVGTSPKNPQHEALVEGFHPIVRGRFLRHGKIYRNEEGEAGRSAGPPPHHCDESSTGYSSAGCSPAEPASASPAGSRLKFRGGVCQGRRELHLPLRTDRVMKKHHGLSAVTKRAPGTPSGRSARRGRGVDQLAVSPMSGRAQTHGHFLHHASHGRMWSTTNGTKNRSRTVPRSPHTTACWDHSSLRASPGCRDQSATRTTATVAGIRAAPISRNPLAVVRSINVLMRDGDACQTFCRSFGRPDGSTAFPPSSDIVFGSFIQSMQFKRKSRGCRSLY